MELTVQLAGPKEIRLYWLLFMDRKRGQERGKILRKHRLKLFGSLKLGRWEKEYEMIIKRTLQSICLLEIHPNTTTSVIVQVAGDDGALLPCAINASCAALVDAGIPLKHLAIAICCGLNESGTVILDPTLAEEQKMQAFAYLAFPNSPMSVLKIASPDEAEPIEHGIITSVTHGVMSVRDYFSCLERGRAACAKISEFLRRSFHSQVSEDSSKATQGLIQRCVMLS